MVPAGESLEVPESAAPDPNMRALLDHIAAELAQEYIRLMEAVASAEPAAETSVVTT